MLPAKVILSPIDFSEHSDEALKEATELAACFGAELCLVHVVPVIPKLPSASAFFHEGQYEQELYKDAQTRLAGLVHKIAERGLRATAVVGTANDVSMELLRIAQEHRVDLIVIATHGMTGWHKLAFGSVTEKVVRLASCPVLVLRAMAESKAEEAAKSASLAV